MKNNETNKIAAFLRAHDPADISPARLELLHAQLWQKVEATPQERGDAISSLGFFLGIGKISIERIAIMGLAALMLGLFAGREMDLSGYGQPYAGNETNSSILALANPWGSYIVEKE